MPNGNRIHFDQGDKYGQLTVLRESEDRRTEYHTHWLVVCDCGHTKPFVVRGARLLDGSTHRCKRCSHESSVATRERRRQAKLLAKPVSEFSHYDWI